MIEYKVDPAVWIGSLAGSPAQVTWDKVVWDLGLVKAFLSKLGDDGWIMVAASPYPIFYREKI